MNTSPFSHTLIPQRGAARTLECITVLGYSDDMQARKTSQRSPLGKNLHPRRWHRENQSVSSWSRWGNRRVSSRTASEQPYGGKFKNGAVTGSFAYVFGSIGRNQSSVDYDAIDAYAANGGFDVGPNALAVNLPVYDFPQGVFDFAAGLGDGITLGGTIYIRDQLNIGSINPNSIEYGAGFATGFAETAVVGVAAVPVAAYGGIRTACTSAILYCALQIAPNAIKNASKFVRAIRQQQTVTRQIGRSNKNKRSIIK